MAADNANGPPPLDDRKPERPRSPVAGQPVTIARKGQIPEGWTPPDWKDSDYVFYDMDEMKAECAQREQDREEERPATPQELYAKIVSGELDG